MVGRLRDTADFRNARGRPLLTGRVLELLQRMQGDDPEVAALCHERIGQALETCGDRVIWAMNQLELALRTHHAQSAAAPQAALRRLAAALVRLEVVHLVIGVLSPRRAARAALPLRCGRGPRDRSCSLPAFKLQAGHLSLEFLEMCASLSCRVEHHDPW